MVALSPETVVRTGLNSTNGELRLASMRWRNDGSSITSSGLLYEHHLRRGLAGVE